MYKLILYIPEVNDGVRRSLIRLRTRDDEMVAELLFRGLSRAFGWDRDHRPGKRGQSQNKAKFPSLLKGKMQLPVLASTIMVPSL